MFLVICFIMLILKYFGWIIKIVNFIYYIDYLIINLYKFRYNSNFITLGVL